MVAIALDAWTSSNQYAFMAIVLHYVTEDWQVGEYSCVLSHFPSQIVHIEEILIDFQEIVGQHSGKNLAEVVWETFKTYGLLGKVGYMILPFLLDVTKSLLVSDNHDCCR